MEAISISTESPNFCLCTREKRSSRSFKKRSQPFQDSDTGQDEKNQRLTNTWYRVTSVTTQNTLNLTICHVCVTRQSLQWDLQDIHNFRDVFQTWLSILSSTSVALLAIALMIAIMPSAVMKLDSILRLCKLVFSCSISAHAWYTHTHIHKLGLFCLVRNYLLQMTTFILAKLLLLTCLKHFHCNIIKGWQNALKTRESLKIGSIRNNCHRITHMVVQHVQLLKVRSCYGQKRRASNPLIQKLNLKSFYLKHYILIQWYHKLTFILF